MDECEVEAPLLDGYTGYVQLSYLITEAAAIDDPRAVQSAPIDLMRRKTTGRAVAITVTAVLAVAVLASLIASAGPSSSARCQAQVSRAAAQSAWSEPLPSPESVAANCN